MRLKSVVLSLTVVGAMLAPLFYAAPAQAQATRTWVSGVGDDANPCSRTAPCKTWAGAIVKTAAGGEIDNLDAGGFGALTITKSITLDGGGGAVASTLTSGTNGIVVAAGSTDVVIIRNIRFQGLLGNGSSPGTSGINAIQFTSGSRLVLDHVDIYGFNNNCVFINLSANGTALIRNSTIQNCTATGVQVTSTGGATVNVVVDNTLIYDAHDGVIANGTAGGTTTVQVWNSDINTMVASGVTALTGSQTTNLFVKNSLLTNNGTGVVSNGAQATALVSLSTITANTTALSSQNSGTLFTYKNNEVNANGSPGSAPTQINGL